MASSSFFLALAPHPGPPAGQVPPARRVPSSMRTVSDVPVCSRGPLQEAAVRCHPVHQEAAAGIDHRHR